MNDATFERSMSTDNGDVHGSIGDSADLTKGPSPASIDVALGAVPTLIFAAAILVGIFCYVNRQPPRKSAAHSPRAPASSARCDEVFLNANEAERQLNATEAFNRGDSLLTIHHLATPAECALLLTEAEAAVEVRRQVRSRNGVFACRQPRYRMPVTNFLRCDTEGRALCDALLRRALVLASEVLPGLATERLGEAAEASLAGIIGNPALQFSEGEPAINVYYAGGEFAPHQDKQRLTVLVALSDAASGAFTGGGTAFWSEDDGAQARAPSSTPPPPTLTVHAPAGTATLFCGEVTHGALPVDAGQRAVFVASFGPIGHDYRHPSRIPKSERLVHAMRRRVARALSS